MSPAPGAGAGRRVLLVLRARGRLRAARGVQVGRGVRVRTTPGARIVLGPAAALGDGCRLEATAATIAVGAGAAVGERAVLRAREGITVGDRALVGDWCILDDAAPDGVPGSDDGAAAPILIGAGARLGPHAVATPGAVVAPGAQVPAYAVRGRGNGLGVERYENFIGGRWIPAPPGADTIPVENPATGEAFAEAPATPPEVVDEAVQRAAAAWETWRWTIPAERARIVHDVADAVAAELDTIATAVTREQGKPLDEARGETRKLAQMLHFYAEEATRTFGRTIPNESDGYLSIVEKEPVGVVAGIVPWNYPVELLGWKLGAALAAGCTIVLKPSEYTPGSAVEVFRCIERAGVPAGVASLVMGAGETGRALVAHPLIAKVAFTGSERTGLEIPKTVTGVTGISLELGGSCPLLVTKSADLALAAKGIVRRGYRNAGQICIAVNRVYAEPEVYDELTQRVADGVRALTVADGLQDPGADVGALCTGENFERTVRHVDEAVKAGGTLLAGGDHGEGPGRFATPTLVADATPAMALMHEETFGPAVGIGTASDLDELSELANSTPAGLAAYVYARDVQEIFTLARRLDFGSVAVNNVDAGIVNAPYGGRKQSGNGYEHGREGLESYLQLKHIRLQHGAVAPGGES